MGPKLYILLHNYGDLCSRLHIYFFTLLLFMLGSEPYHSPTTNYTQSTPKHVSMHR